MKVLNREIKSILVKTFNGNGLIGQENLMKHYGPTVQHIISLFGCLHINLCLERLVIYGWILNIKPYGN